MPGPDEAGPGPDPAEPGFDPIDVAVRTNRIGECVSRDKEPSPSWHGRPVVSREWPEEWGERPTAQAPAPGPPAPGVLRLHELRRAVMAAHPHGKYLGIDAKGTGLLKAVPVQVHLFRPGEDHPHACLNAFGVVQQNWLAAVVVDGVARKQEQPALFALGVEVPDPQPQLPTRGQPSHEE